MAAAQMMDFTPLEQKYGLPQGLLSAVAQVESGNNPNAVSPKGAQGLFQFMPSTAQQYGINPLDPVQAAEGAARYYGDLLKQNNGNLDAALASYNFGPGNVSAGKPLPPETQNYIAKVKSFLPQQVADSGQIQSDALPEGFVLDNAPAPAASGLPEGFVLDSPSPQSQKPGLFDTISDQAVQGATFGLGNKAEAGLAALALSAINKQPLSKNYENVRKLQDDRLAAERINSPLTSLAANIGGGIATGGLAADTTAGSSLANWLGSGGRAARVGKGALAGAASGAAYGGGAADYNTGPLAGAKQGAISGALVGGAIPAVGAGLRSLADTIVPPVQTGLRNAAELAQQYGIPLGLDQVTGSKARQFLSSASARVPLSGGQDLASNQRQAFTAAIAKAVGADDLTNSGFDKALTNVGDKFDEITKGKTISVPQDIKDRVSQIVSDAADSLEESKAAVVARNAQKFLSGIGEDGTIAGEKLGSLRSAFTKAAKNAGEASQFIGQLRDAVIDATVDGSPQARSALNAARTQYKNLMTIAPLVAKDGTGEINPTLLKNRVIQSYGVNNVARGKAGALGDLAKVADLIKSRVGDSGTAERLIAYHTLMAAPGAAIGALSDPQDRLGGAAAGALGSIALARGYQKYNASSPLVNMALQRGVAIGGPNIGVLGAIQSGNLANYAKKGRIGMKARKE